MIIAKIIQDGQIITLEDIVPTFQYSADLKMQFVRDENYADAILTGWYKRQKGEEYLLNIKEDGIFTLNQDVFSKEGSVYFSFALNYPDGKIVHLGIVEYFIKKSFGNSNAILPEEKETWISVVSSAAREAIKEDVELVKEKATESSNNAKRALESATSASDSASISLTNANKAKEHLDSVTEKTNAFNANYAEKVNSFNQDYVSKVETFNSNVENANKTLNEKITNVNFEIDKKLNKNLGEENSNKLLGTDGEGNIIVKDDIQLTAENISYNNSNVDLALDDVYEKLGDLMYIPISITSLTNNKNTVEMGTTITDVVLNWNYNKVPKALTLDNETLDVNLKTKTLSGQNITSNKTYTLKATDERNAVATKTTSITFLNGVYYGIGDDLEIDSITNQFILSLTKTLQSSKAKAFTVNAGESKYIYYAVPSRYGTPTFKIGGFEGGFGKLGTFNFINGSGYAENYDVYKSSNSNLGNTTVVVS